MKPGLEQVHSKAMLDFLEKRQLHPIEALQILSISSLSILASYVEFDMTSEEKTQLAIDIDAFSNRLRELLKISEEDLFAVLLSIQVLNRELIESATVALEAAAKEAASKNASPATMS